MIQFNNMTLYMSKIESTILSVGVMIIFVIAIYFLTKLFLKNYKNNNEKKMLTLNMTIKYKVFEKFVNVAINNNEQYNLYLINIDNFNLILNNYPSGVVNAYVKHFAKNLSISLPLGGKLAQTNKRSTFILYIPINEVSEINFNHMLNNAATIPYNRNGNLITSNINVGYLLNTSNNFNDDLVKLNQALISSKRSLGYFKPYNNNEVVNVSEFANTLANLNDSSISYLLYDVYKTALEKNEEVYTKILINNNEFSLAMKNYNLADLAWINFELIERLLITNEKQVNRHIVNLPILLCSLEVENFISKLQNLMVKYQYSNAQTVISVNNSTVSNSNAIIKNIHNLKTLGFKLSFLVDEIKEDLYSLIGTYQLDRIELTESIYQNKTKELENLLRFAKVNHIEVLLISDLELADNNISHLAKYSKRHDLTNNSKRKGMKK